MKILTWVLALVASGVPHVVLACNPYVVHRQAVVVKQQVVAAVVVQPVLVAQYVPLVVSVPQYSVGLSASYVAPQVQPQATPAAAVAPAPAQASTATVATEHARILVSKCAACHDAAVANSKGGKLTLSSGDSLVELSDRQAMKVISQAYSSKMPKVGDKLSDAEIGVLMQWLESRK